MKKIRYEFTLPPEAAKPCLQDGKVSKSFKEIEYELSYLMLLSVRNKACKPGVGTRELEQIVRVS